MNTNSNRPPSPSQPADAAGVSATAALCDLCAAGPAGPDGHAAMRYQLVGPYPGQRICECADCGERWIRRVDEAGAPAWARYAVEFPSWKPVRS